MPQSLRLWLRQGRKKAERSLLLFDRVTDWSTLHRLRPYRAEFGGRRGKYIDRFYIEAFLTAYRSTIRGRVGEFESDQYIRMFGDGRVQDPDILDIDVRNEKRTMTLDLQDTEAVPENLFDCIICTQTLFLIRDYVAAVRSLCKMLKPGGNLLVTLPGLCPTVRGGLVAGVGDDWWRFTGLSAHRIFAEVFGDENVVVHTYGNVLTATAFMHGLVQEELTQEELEFHDPDFQVIIGVRVTKPCS
jgi:SAM-dependent methyltransferase